MALTVAQLALEISATGADTVKKSLGGINDEAGKHAGLFQKATAGLAGFFTAGAAVDLVKTGFSAVTDAVGGFISAANEANIVQAQTEAGLKSTHAASGMTAQGISDLATKISNLSGIDDEAVQTGENMLLTFTSIGRDVFPMAAQAAADMATKMAGGAIPTAQEMQQQSLLLGKALNDPAKGLTALTREGVTFTDAQKKQITTMEKAGNTAGAQKIILGELQREFGGAAQAAGDTFAGKMAKLNVQWQNMQEAIGNALIPVLSKLIDKLQPVINQVSAALPGALNAVMAAINPVVNVVGFLADHFEQLKPILVAAAIGIATVLVPSLIAWAISAGAAAIATLAAAAPFILVAAGVALLVLGVKLLIDHLGQIGALFGTVGGIIKDFVGHALGAIGDFIGNVLGAIGNFVGGILGKIGELKDKALATFGLLWNSLTSMVGSFVLNILLKIGQLELQALAKIGQLKDGVISTLQQLPGRMLAIGQSIIDGLLNALKTGAGRIMDWLKGLASNMLSTIKGVFGIASPSREMAKIGDALGAGLVAGLVGHQVHQKIGAHLAGLAANAADAIGGAHGHGAHLSGHATRHPHAPRASLPGRAAATDANGEYVIYLQLDNRTIGKALMPYLVAAARQAGVKAT